METGNLSCVKVRWRSLQVWTFRRLLTGELDVSKMWVWSTWGRTGVSRLRSTFKSFLLSIFTETASKHQVHLVNTRIKLLHLFLHIYKVFLQLQTFFAHIQIFVQTQNLFTQLFFFTSKCLLKCWFCIFPHHGSAFAPHCSSLLLTAPHCSSSDPVTPAAPPSTSPVPLVIGLVGGITLILLLLLLLLCWCRNSKSESCSCSFHFNQTYSKLLSRYSWRLKNKIM